MKESGRSLQRTSSSPGLAEAVSAGINVQRAQRRLSRDELSNAGVSAALAALQRCTATTSATETAPEQPREHEWKEAWQSISGHLTAALDSHEDMLERRRIRDKWEIERQERPSEIRTNASTWLPRPGRKQEKPVIHYPPFPKARLDGEDEHDGSSLPPAVPRATLRSRILDLQPAPLSCKEGTAGAPELGSPDSPALSGPHPPRCASEAGCGAEGQSGGASAFLTQMMLSSEPRSDSSLQATGAQIRRSNILRQLSNPVVRSGERSRPPRLSEGSCAGPSTSDEGRAPLPAGSTRRPYRASEGSPDCPWPPQGGLSRRHSLLEGTASGKMPAPGEAAEAEKTTTHSKFAGSLPLPPRHPAGLPSLGASLPLLPKSKSAGGAPPLTPSSPSSFRLRAQGNAASALVLRLAAESSSTSRRPQQPQPSQPSLTPPLPLGSGHPPGRFVASSVVQQMQKMASLSLGEEEEEQEEQVEEEEEEEEEEDGGGQQAQPEAGHACAQELERRLSDASSGLLRMTSIGWQRPAPASNTLGGSAGSVSGFSSCSSLLQRTESLASSHQHESQQAPASQDSRRARVSESGCSTTSSHLSDLLQQQLHHDSSAAQLERTWSLLRGIQGQRKKRASNPGELPPEYEAPMPGLPQHQPSIKSGLEPGGKLQLHSREQVVLSARQVQGGWKS